MIRSTRLLLVGAAVVLAGVLLSPVVDVRPGAPAEAAVPSSSLELFTVQANEAGAAVDYMPVNSKGRSKPEMKDDRTILTFPMIELATGKVIGTIVDDIKAPIPGILFDVTTYFKFPDGELVNHMLVSSAPDVQRPGWIIVGNRPDSNSIVKASGVFQGRTGKIRLSGTNDLTKFPNEVYQDDFWVIELNK
ncbi:MAG: hypothetical protein M3357_17870 [Actinomycetota bacterium]|nr:hypothetical protein [Actinomycetota bacterium]